MEAQNQYRAWHKVRKEMYNVHGWHSEYVFKDTLDGVGCDDNPDRLEDVILMQCTGFKEDKEVEVYRGDIIKNQMGKMFIVDWGEFGFEVSNYNIKPINPLNKIAGNERYSLGYYIQLVKRASIKIKVIGNIYQNPKLLNEEVQPG